MIIYIVENAIFLIEDYTLNTNRNSKLFAGTYLIVKPDLKVPSITQFFRDTLILVDLKIKNNGEIELTVESYHSSYFTKRGFNPHPNRQCIRFKIANGKTETLYILQKANLLPTN